MLVRLIILLLFMASPAQATIWFDDSFELSTPEAGGWDYAAGWCRPAGGATIHPCLELDQSTEQAHSGSKSMRGTYNAAWSDPNPQTHEQAMTHTIPSSQNVYVRRWEKQVGFVPTSYTGTKIIYYRTAGRAPSTFSIYFFGSRVPSFSVQGIKTTCPPNSGAGAGATQEYQTCNFYPNMAQIPVNNDQWYCIEEHISYGTPGVANGMLEIWINDVQVLGYYNQMFLGTSDHDTNATTGPGIAINGPSSTMVGVQLFKQNGGGFGSANGYVYWDQVASGNERIGCGGAPPVTPDTTPPSAPSGLTSTGQTSSSIALQWTNGTDQVSSSLAAPLESCQGVACTNFQVLTSPSVLNGAVSTFTHAGLPASTTRCYRVRNLDNSGNPSSYSPTVCAATTAAPVAQSPVTLATVTFDSDESPLSNGGTFDGGYTGFGNLDVVSGGVRPSVLGTRGLMSYNDEGSLDNQSCEWTVTTFAGSILTEQGCALMMANAPTATFYLAKAILNGAQHYQIVEYTNGTPVELSGGSGVAWVNGDRGRLEVQDGQFRLYRNGVLWSSASDASLTSGKPGLYAYTASGGGAGSLTFDSANSTQSTSGPSTLSWNHTVGAGSNGGLFVCVVARGFSPGPPAISGVTANGDAMTLVRNTTADWGGGYSTEAQAALYRLVNPDTGVIPIVVSFSSPATRETAAGSISYFGVDQSTPVEASNGSAATSSTATVSVTTLTNNAVVMDCLLGKPNPPASATGGRTERMNRTITDDVGAMSTIVKATAGAQTMPWTLSTSDQYVLSAMSIKPAGGDTGDLSQNVLDNFAVGTWQAVSSDPPVIAGATSDITGANLTYGATAPTYIRVLTGSNTGEVPTSDVEYAIASFPGGRYTAPSALRQNGYSFECFFARDANHVESAGANDYRCNNISLLTQTDTTAPVLTAGFPDGQTLTATSVVLAMTSNELATVKIDTSDVAYDTLANTMETIDQINHAFSVSGLSNGSYTYYACGRDKSIGQNTCTTRTPISFTVNTGGADSTAPTAPANLVCPTLSQTQATCTFEASTDGVGVIGYRATIGNGAPCTPTMIVNPGWSTATTQTLNGLIPNTTYCLIAQGLDAAGNVSASSNVASFTTLPSPDPVPPTVVPHCWATAGSLYTLTLQCDPASDLTGIASYTFEVCTGATCGDFTAIGTKTLPLMTYSDASQDTVYRFRVIARDVSGNVSRRYSKIVTVSTSEIGWTMTPALSPGKRTP